jgi:hypothetical protein
MFGAKHATVLCQDWYYLQTDRNELPLEPCQLGVPSGASKMISEPVVCLAQNMQLSCVKIGTISKQIETSFHLSHITNVFNRVCSK